MRAQVGAAICTTMLVNVVSPHGFGVLMSFLSRAKAAARARCCARSEHQLARVYTAPVFELAPRCGALLNTLYSTLLFAPGCPILVPGQVVSKEILAYMRALDVNEIHGYQPEAGLQVFTQEALEGQESR